MNLLQNVVAPVSLLELAIVAGLGVATGWTVHGWQVDAADLAAERAAKVIVDRTNVRDAGIATRLESALLDVQANKSVIDRGIIREIQSPIYRNVCLGDDVVRLLNAGAANARTSDSAEPFAEVPGNPTPAH